MDTLSLATNCCRTCLSSQNLYPIFHETHHERYTNILLAATGQKITINDSLPQEMCSVCISFVNSITKFWRRCQETHVALLKLTNGGNLFDIIKETHNISAVNVDDFTQIDVTASFFADGNGFNLNHDGCDGNNDSYDLKCDAKSIYVSPDRNLNDDEEFDHEDNICLDSLKLEKSSNTLDESISHITDALKKKCDSNDKTTKVRNERRKKDENVPIESKEQNAKKSKVCKTKRDQETEEENENGVRNKRKGNNKRGEEGVVCDVCNKVLMSKVSLRNHYKIHTGFNVVCEHCGKKFMSRHFLLMHCRAKHGYEKTDKCSFCDYKGSNAEQVKIHERLHTGEKPFSCKECSAGFHRRSSYMQHVAIHLPHRTVLCDKCPARFKSVTLMRIHASKHLPPKYQFRCHVCDNKFARPRNVLRHLLKLHNIVGSKNDYTRVKI